MATTTQSTRCVVFLSNGARCKHPTVNTNGDCGRHTNKNSAAQKTAAVDVDTTERSVPAPYTDLFTDTTDRFDSLFGDERYEHRSDNGVLYRIFKESSDRYWRLSISDHPGSGGLTDRGATTDKEEAFELAALLVNEDRSRLH